MNGDRLKGKWMQVKGEVKQQWGKLIGDDSRQIEGNYEKVIGMLQERYGGNCVNLARERYGQKKDELIRWASQWRQGEEADIMTSRNMSWIARFLWGLRSVKNLLTLREKV